MMEWDRTLAILLVVLSVAGIAGMKTTSRQRQFERGRKLSRESKYGRKGEGLRWGSCWIPEDSATQHFLAVGTTGSGKSLVQRLLMKSALLDIKSGADKRALILDAKNDTVSFLDRIGSTCPVYTLNPFDGRSERPIPVAWDIAADRRYETVASMLGIDFETVAAVRAELGVLPPEQLTDYVSNLVSLVFSRAFGCSFPQGQLSNELRQPFSSCNSLVQDWAAKNCKALDALVDDEGHAKDLASRVEAALEQVQLDENEYGREICDLLSIPSLRLYFQKTFFGEHIRRYSRSRRKAPIFWQLATASSSYSVWLYYHRFTRDTFFQVQNEYVTPKLGHERKKLDRLQGEAGADPSMSQRKAIEEQQKFVAELATMSEEIARIAPLWNPNLNDGVIINFAPLWRLVPQNKSWQKECKKVWDKLVKGEYDWAHLAMHLWPDRVVPKCVTDASLAIAHGLEKEFWEQDERQRFQPKDEPESGWQPVVERLVKERTSPAVKAALQSLLEAPVPSNGSSRTRRRRGSS